MAENSKIDWTHHTFNPWTGCTKVSEGCKHCYAETFSGRKLGTIGEWGPKGSRKVTSESYWQQPRRWDVAAWEAGERHRVFCASLADVFESQGTMPAESWEAVQAARRRLWDIIEITPQLDWLLLTKRPENIARLIDQRWLENPLPNVWLGTSVEDQATADERIPQLLNVPAAIRFLSCEPLLGPVDLLRTPRPGQHHDFLTGEYEAARSKSHTARIDWVIAGGESGPGARPMHPDWARSLRDQCQEAEVSFLFKQWGEWGLGKDHPDKITVGSNTQIIRPKDGKHDPLAKIATVMVRVGKKTAGRELDGRTWDEYPTPLYATQGGAA